MKEEITKYYDDLAASYDENRFANTYGSYIHKQELKVLQKYLSESDFAKNIDLACGTGRFLSFADYGADISSKMVEQAQMKFPKKNIQVAQADQLPFQDKQFQNSTCFHLFMHLNSDDFVNILHEQKRVLSKEGLFIFDVPSKKRRALSGRKSDNWHASHQESIATIKQYMGTHWELVNYHGIAFFPIHIIPARFRKYFIPLDNFFSNSILKEFSSHLIVILKKK